MKGKKEALVRTLSLPRDLCLGAAVVTAVGCTSLTVENHRGILEYGPDRIRILSGMCRIQVLGSGLVISYFGRDSMKIEGRIREIIYE